MIGWLNWGGSCIVNNGCYTYSVFPSKTDHIMSKYRRIAPKPPLLSSNLCEVSPNFDSAMNSLLKQTTHKGNSSTKRGRSGSRSHRKSSYSSNSDPTRGQKRARGPNNPSDLISEKRRVVQSVTENSIPADGPNILYPSDKSFELEKASVEKQSGVLEIAAAAALTKESVVDEEAVGYAGLNKKEIMQTMKIVPVEGRTTDIQCGCGYAKFLSSPNVSDIEEQQQQEEGEENLLTLNLLPETPSLNDSVLDSRASSLTWDVGDSDEKANKSNTSYDTEEFQLRLFGVNFFVRNFNYGIFY